jgi:hypothetical protein
MSRLFIGALVLGSLFAWGATTRADEVEELDVRTSSPVNQNRAPERDDSWYYHPSNEPTVYKPNPQQIVQQKAMVRGQQRADRLASLDWYGRYNGRPTAAPTPFCSQYSPTWQSPGGKPFVWYPARPVYIFR